MTRLNILLVLAGLALNLAVPGANDCRYYKNCGMYSSEPYKVTYSYPSEHWGYEKRFEDNRVVLKARELETAEEYRHPLPPINQSIQFQIEDVFALGGRVHHYATTIEDEQGREHFLRLEWNSHFKTKDRSLFFLKRRKVRHYVKVTLNDKLLFLIDDEVDKGAYDYEDFFRVGNRKYRIMVSMQSHRDNYYFGATLVDTY